MDLSVFDWIIFGGGWTNDYEMINDVAKCKGVRTGLLHCSPFGQTDLCSEIQYLNHAISLLNNKKLDIVFTGTKEMADVMGSKFVFLPQTMDYSSFINAELDQHDSFINLFNVCGINKNALNQVLACKLAGKVVVTNSCGQDSDITHFMNRVGVKYFSHSWLNDEDYLRVLKSCRIGLQCSWSEAFDYVAAELSCLGIPVLTSSCVSWNLPELIVNNVDSPFEILTKINSCLSVSSDVIKSNIRKELDVRAEIARHVLSSLLSK